MVKHTFFMCLMRPESQIIKQIHFSMNVLLCHNVTMEKLDSGMRSQQWWLLTGPATFNLIHYTTTDLKSHSVLVFSLHVIDVPGDSCHGVDGLYHHIIPVFLRVKVFGYFLKQTSKIKIKSQGGNTTVVELKEREKRYDWCPCELQSISERSEEGLVVCTWSSRWYLRILWTGLRR